VLLVIRYPARMGSEAGGMQRAIVPLRRRMRTSVEVLAMIVRTTAAALAALFAFDSAAAADGGLCDERTSERDRVVGERGNAPCLLLGGSFTEGETEFSTESQSAGYPVLYASYGRLYVDFPELGYYLLGSESGGGYWGLAALLELPADGFEVRDETHLADLEDREPTLEGGLKLIAGGEWGTVEIGANADLEGAHDGYSVRARYELPLRLDTLTFSPGLFATYRDEANGDYYYGVDEDETSTARPAFEVDEPTLGVGVGYSLNYRLGPDWGLFHSLRIRVLDELLDDSPLTVIGEPSTLSVGVLYRAY